MSSPPLRVFLTKNQEKTLFELSRSKQVPQRTSDRASALRLSSMEWKVEKIAVYLKWSKQTVRETIHRWKKQGLMGLWDAPRGRKRKWMPEDLAEIESKLDTEQRTYHSHQLCQLLETERKISLSERHLRRILLKKTIDGKERESLLKASKIR